MRERKNSGACAPPKTQVTLLPDGGMRIEVFDAPENTESMRPKLPSVTPANGAGSDVLREVLLRIGATAARPDNGALLEQYMPLVRRIAYRLVRRLPAHISVEDLIAAGHEGLFEAISKFDPARGTSLEQYASYRISGAMMDELRRLDPLGRDTRARARRLGKAVHRLSQRLGRAPETSEIAEELDMSVADCRELLLVIKNSKEASIDRLVTDGAVNVLADEQGGSPCDAAEISELRKHMAQALAKLPVRLGRILNLYYYENLNLREIGEVLGVTESRVCQLHDEAMQQLRQILPPEGES